MGRTAQVSPRFLCAVRLAEIAVEGIVRAAEPAEKRVVGKKRDSFFSWELYGGAGQYKTAGWICA
jgi:hypothetical protein